MHNLHNNRLPLTLLIGLWAVLIAGGCGRSSTNVPTEKITATEVRSARRAFAGAPPVIPHVSQKADCVTCHTTTGRQVPNMGFAAANPHEGSSVAGATQNCRQCHLFRGADAVFVASTFEGISPELRKGSRAYPGAPPMIPHSQLMRENCQACHSGPSARPEIRCTHTDRVNCVQCHLFQSSSPEFAEPQTAANFSSAL